MATSDGTRGDGEGGGKLIPNHAAVGDLAGGCAPELVGPAESRIPGGEKETPAPTRGLMHRKCRACGAQMGSVEVPVGDPTDGMTSDDYCGPCERDARAQFGLPPVVEAAIKAEDQAGPRFVSEGCKAFLVALGLFQLPGAVGL